MKKIKNVILIVVFMIILSMATALLSGALVYHNMNQSLLGVEWELIETKKSLKQANADHDVVMQELDNANQTIADLKSDEYELVYMGDFKISYYCNELYLHTCGGTGRTASGKPTEIGLTAAADWSVLPKGSMVYIEGVGFREIQDKGGAVKGKHIDVLVDLHSTAQLLGVHNEGVWLLVKQS